MSNCQWCGGFFGHRFECPVLEVNALRARVAELERMIASSCDDVRNDPEQTPCSALIDHIARMAELEDFRRDEQRECRNARDAWEVTREALRKSEARVAELEANRKWLLACSVFPQSNFMVLVCWETTNDHPVIGMLDGGEEGQWVDHDGDPFPVPPSHWMPLPDPVNP